MQPSIVDLKDAERVATVGCEQRQSCFHTDSCSRRVQSSDGKHSVNLKIEISFRT